MGGAGIKVHCRLIGCEWWRCDRGSGSGGDMVTCICGGGDSCGGVVTVCVDGVNR